MERKDLILSDEFVIGELEHGIWKHFYNCKQNRAAKARVRAELIFKSEFEPWIQELRELKGEINEN